MADMILLTEKDSENAQGLARFVDKKPVNRHTQGQMPKARHQFFVDLATMGDREKAIRFRPQRPNPGLGMTEGRRRIFAKPLVAFEQMIENQLEVPLGVGGKLKPIRHLRGASRRS